MKHISRKIKYENISEKQFSEFIKVLKKVDYNQALKESNDGFLDLYNYWNERGCTRLYSKIKDLKFILQGNDL